MTKTGNDAPACGRESAAPQTSEPHGLRERLAGVEHDLILAALRESNGNKAKAARALGISQRLMGIRVQRLGIDWRGLRKRPPVRTREG
jgi:Nif-specific regulatory protein